MSEPEDKYNGRELNICDLEDKYGRRERMDSCISVVLSHYELPRDILTGWIAMGFRYQSVAACEAYNTQEIMKSKTDQNKWTVTQYGPVIIGPGVYEVLLITRK